jgi:hypothetical protein
VQWSTHKIHAVLHVCKAYHTFTGGIPLQIETEVIPNNITSFKNITHIALYSLQNKENMYDKMLVTEATFTSIEMNSNIYQIGINYIYMYCNHLNLIV